MPTSSSVMLAGASSTQFEIADHPTLGQEQMQLVAEDRLLLRAAMAEGGPSRLPVEGGMRHIGELDHGNGQALDDALRVVGQVQDLQHTLPDEVDGQRHGSSAPVEARALGLLRKQVAVLLPAAQQDGILVPSWSQPQHAPTKAMVITSASVHVGEPGRATSGASGANRSLTSAYIHVQKSSKSRIIEATSVGPNGTVEIDPL